jgi:hypothetical protein
MVSVRGAGLACGWVQNAVDIPDSVKASLTTDQLKKLEVRT